MNSLYKILVSLSLSTAIIIILLSFHLKAAVPQPPEKPSDYIVDLAGVMKDGDKNKLRSMLIELETKTKAQIFVLTIHSLEGELIEEFSLKIAELWKPGQRGQDIGVLITVAVSDKRIRIETGYGAESILPDSLTGTIRREYMVPYFRKNDYSRGILEGTQAIINEIAGASGVKITGAASTLAATAERQRNKTKKIGLIDIILGSLFIIVAIIFFARNPGLLLFFLASRGAGNGWSGGRSYGGGGFGGGGGGFGGGGSSGDW